VLLLLIAGVVASGWAAFGAKPQGARLARTQQSPEWSGDRFKDPQTVWIDTRRAFLHAMFGKAPAAVEPLAHIPVVVDNKDSFAKAPSSGLRVTWFGHSSALVELDDRNILIDPFWSERASPIAGAGPKRWYPPPIALNDLPRIDVVLISHDHYDHLDYGTIVAMRQWRNIFVVPLGIGAHLEQWGIAPERIVELDWWQSTRQGDVEFVATPSRHSSGRLAPSSDRTLWAGFAILGPRHRVWYSGDTSYHAGLVEIGQRLGPFDVTLIESGQYDANWVDNHLGPELAVQANIDVRGRVMIPVHWALIKLAVHTWTEPIERVKVAAECHGVEVLAPRPGESVEPTEHPVIAPWWPKLPFTSARDNPIVATINGNPGQRVSVAAGNCSGGER
jgi:L-ascorbate metabolism protein UlaG (beta-lactamase superfamily)